MAELQAATSSQKKAAVAIYDYRYASHSMRAAYYAFYAR